MKVFEVITERLETDSHELITQRQYVSSADDSILTVTKWYALHCEQYEEELKMVREAITVSHRIPKSEIEEME